MRVWQVCVFWGIIAGTNWPRTRPLERWREGLINKSCTRLVASHQSFMADIFLINFRNLRDMYPPFGIMYVADALIKAGFETRIFHETEDYLDEFVREVERVRPL